MWEPESCCCFKLRTGSLILGFLVLIGAVLNVLSSILVLTDETVGQLVVQTCTNNSSDDYTAAGCEETMWKILNGIVIGSMVISIIQALISSLLIYGIFKNKTRLSIPYMIMMMIYIIIVTLIAMACIILLSIQQQWQAMLISTIVFAVHIFLETYFLLVIRAYYLQVKRAKSGLMMLE